MYSIIVFAPLIGAAAAGLFGRILGERASQYLTTALLFVSAALSVTAFVTIAFGHQTAHVEILPWIEVGTFKAHWAFKIDSLTAVMLVVVTGVSSLVHLYSIGYMAHDPHKPRFFSYLSLFTFAMLMLVTADNLVQLYFGWEGVGLASYLLIGFWYLRPSANAAAIKAFLVNRVGDFGFGLGIFATYLVFGTIVLDDIFAQAHTMLGMKFGFLGHQVDVLTTICLLLFVGAMGKSAQIFLHTWLPDAMEGPTPVSALIHAATMVTAGVFMVCRLSPLFELAPTALAVVTVIGATTAFFAATVGLVQNDIKRVIAYSTCSQLGYMFMAAGVSAYGAAMFHLFTHAAFKALLFLGAGSVIHGLHDEQDLRNMGGLYRKLPYTYALMIIGTISLMGFPFTAGFYSKDAIIESAYRAGTSVGDYGFVMGVLVAFMTAFYSWRLIFLAFHGRTRADHHSFDGAHDSPPVMLVPLIVLAAGALVLGFAFDRVFIGEDRLQFWNGALQIAAGEQHPIADWVAYSPTVAGLLGVALAWYFYIQSPETPKQLAQEHQVLYRFLLNKWYFDEIYDFLFVNPAKRLGRFLWKFGDGKVIDGLGPDGFANSVLAATRRIVMLQSGYVYHYAFVMLIGIAVLLSFFELVPGAPK